MAKADIPTVKNFAIGYIAVDGKQALVGSTGIFCVPDEKPRCVPNHDPAAILASGKSFKAPVGGDERLQQLLGQYL